MKSQAPDHTQTAPTKTFLAAGWAGALLATARPGGDAPRSHDDLRASSWRSLWSLQLFLTISIAAFFVRDVNLYTTLPDSVLQILGCPPPPALAHLALAGYVVTVLIPLGIQLLGGDPPPAQWRHLGYRGAFYAFYLFSATLASHFFLVFATGMFLYLLEQAGLCVALAKAGHGNGQVAG